jgi:hypothetical protein
MAAITAPKRVQAEDEIQEDEDDTDPESCIGSWGLARVQHQHLAS